jgi:hypothetical protein
LFSGTSHLFEAAIEKNGNVRCGTRLKPRVTAMEQPMTKLGLFGAAAVVLSSALAGPVMAQQVISNPGYCAQFYPNANCQNKGPNNPYTGDYQRRTQNNGNWGFAPGYVAAGAVAGAVGTADAIAAAPFGGNSYASYNSGDRGWYGYGPNYKARNGLACEPGSMFKGDDGRLHPCQ